MPNILTDTSATYTAAGVFTGTKTNTQDRVDTDSAEYVTAQWGQEVDAGLQNVNAFLVGDSSAGRSGTTASFLGSISCAENGAIAGAAPSDVSGTGLAVGDVAVDENVLQIQSTLFSRLLFSDAADADVGGVSYGHAANEMLFVANTVNFATMTFAEAVFGTGSASFVLALDGGSVDGQEPTLSFRQGSVEVASIVLEEDGRLVVSADAALTLPRMTTAQRIALAFEEGTVVYDTDLNALMLSSTSAWGELGASGSSSVHYEGVSFDMATSTTDAWVPFYGQISETAQTNDPRSYHLWRVPNTGTVETVRLVSESDPGVTTLQFAEPDGTAVGVAATGVVTDLPGTAGAGLLHEIVYTFLTPVPLSVGDFVALGFNLTTTAGEVAGAIELQIT